MDLITNSPGLQHLAEDIFKHLNYIDLEKCAQVNDSWKRICENPYFLLSSCIFNGHLEANKIAWQQNTLQIMKDADQKNLEKLIKVLKRILDHNKYGKCAKHFCVFCYHIGTMDPIYYLIRQRFDDIPEDPFFVCPFQCHYQDCSKQFPQKLLLQEHLTVFHNQRRAKAIAYIKSRWGLDDGDTPLS